MQQEKRFSCTAIGLINCQKQDITHLEAKSALLDHAVPEGVLTEGDEPRFGREEENAVKG
jgi:hypothetical protein